MHRLGLRGDVFVSCRKEDSRAQILFRAYGLFRAELRSHQKDLFLSRAFYSVHLERNVGMGGVFWSRHNFFTVIYYQILKKDVISWPNNDKRRCYYARN